MIARRILAGSILVASLTAQAEPPNPKIVARYQEMLAAKPTEGTALDRLWQLFLDQNKTAELIDGYKKDNTFASQMVLGHLLRKAAQPVEAAAAFERAAALDPKSPLPWLAQASLRAETGAHQEAAGALENALALLPERDPQQAEILLRLGAEWLAAGDIAPAAEAWERTVALDPTNLDLRRRLATVCTENRLPERALAHLDFLVKNAPPQDRAQALQQMARVYQGTGAQDEALASLARALAFTAPGNWLRAELQSQIIRLHQRYHRVPELEQRWKENVRASPRDLSAYLQLIDLYERTGELGPQREWLGKLAALAPKTPEYRIKLARLLVHMDDLDGAVALYETLLKEQPANVDLIFERARLDVQRDQVDAACARIAALLASAKDQETVRGKALEFYETYRLNDLLEAHLKGEAASGAEEPVLALANFLFTQKREAEAQAALDRLVPADAPKEAQAAALFKQAQILKTQNDLAAAANTLSKAIPLAAEPREMWLLLGEIQTALGKTTDARLAFAQAVATSTKADERIAADQKLFESFRVEPGKPESPRRPFTLSPPIVENNEPNSVLQSYLLGITRAAVEKPSVEGWLRVARWHLWSRSQRPAIEYAQKALALAPDSIEVRELMLKLASADPRGTEAIAQLNELQRIDPARRVEYRRRTGQIELQAGRVGEAERIFTELTQETPGNIEALTDLALTQQRGEAWEKALATWQQIVALSPASRKKDAAGPLLRVYEKLNRHREAAAIMLSQIDATADEKDQLAAFADLLNLCVKHELVDWLRGEIEARRKLRADDYFIEMALGRILKATGNKAAAFEVLADASFAAPNQAEALPELVREAEELRKLDAAVRLQAQLVRIVPDPGPTALTKLAQLQEKSADLDGAGKTWERIAAKFPRDAATLEQAVAFQIRGGASVRAAELLRRIRALDPGNVRILAQLAQLDIEAGQAAEAQQCLEQILATSAPERSDEPLRIPGVKAEDAGRLQSTYLYSMNAQQRRAASDVMRALRSFYVEEDAPGHTDHDVRLGAIRDLGKLIQIKGDPAATTAWVQRWRTTKAAPTESLWALFFAGASGPLLDHVDQLLAEKPNDPQLKQGFIWLALQTGEFDRLGAWHLDKKRTPSERDFLLIALGQHLQTRPGKIEPGVIEKLFPEGYLLRAWQTASLLGNRGNFREAAQLGERVFRSLSTQRARYGLELAHWHLYLGEIDIARRYLRESLDSPGESFEAPVYSVLREYYLLLPPAERASFSETFLKAIDPEKRPLHATLSRALLAGLAGRDDEARTQLRRLLELGAMSRFDDDEESTSASRGWDAVLVAGVQLQSWKLDALAEFLWQTALEDEALIRLEIASDATAARDALSKEARSAIQVRGGGQGEQILSRTRDIRARLTALQLIRASPLDAPAILEKYQQVAGAESLNLVADALEAAEAYPQAVMVQRELWEREPANQHTMRSLTAACRAANDHDTLEEVLRRCVREGLFRATDAMHRDLAMQLADLLDRRGAYHEARSILSEAIDNTPADTRLLQRLAILHERAGRLTEAEAACRRLIAVEPRNTSACISLAGILDAQNRAPAAIDVLEKFSGADVDPKLVQLYFKAGRLEDAMAALERIPPPNQNSAALLLADAIVKTGAFPQAQSVLRQAMARNPELRTNHPLQSRLIEILQPLEDHAAIAREVRRLRKMSGDQPELVSGYDDLMVREAPRLQYESEFAHELSQDWDNGAGPPLAGIALLDWLLAKSQRPAAEALWTKVLAREDLTESILAKAVQIFTDAKAPELAVQAHARLARLTPLNYTRMFDWINALHALGRDPEALTLLDEVAWRGVLNNEIAAQAANLYVELKKPARARELFAHAVAGDPSARTFHVHLEFARVLLADGDIPAARQRLRTAFRNPANRELGEIISFLQKTGRLADFDQEISGFELRPQMILTARRALFAHHEKAKDIPAAVALLDEHPEVMEPGTCARLRALATEARAFEKVGTLFEKIVQQSPLESLEPRAELAALYGEWAEDELAASQEDHALAHLKRSHELKADLFTPMQRLADLLAKRGDPAAAGRVVQDFLTTSQSAAEKEKAQRIFERLEQ